MSVGKVLAIIGALQRIAEDNPDIVEQLGQIQASRLTAGADASGVASQGDPPGPWTAANLARRLYDPAPVLVYEPLKSASFFRWKTSPCALMVSPPSSPAVSPVILNGCCLPW